MSLAMYVRESMLTYPVWSMTRRRWWPGWTSSPWPEHNAPLWPDHHRHPLLCPYMSPSMWGLPLTWVMCMCVVFEVFFSTQVSTPFLSLIFSPIKPDVPPPPLPPLIKGQVGRPRIGIDILQLFPHHYSTPAKPASWLHLNFVFMERRRENRPGFRKEPQ